MFAGKSKYEIGTRIIIKNCPDEDLNGLTGRLTNPFACYLPADYVGVYLDDEMVVVHGICNLESEDEFEVLNEPEKQICQCCSCEQIFMQSDLDNGDCPHCFSGNWVFGYIDD